MYCILVTGMPASGKSTVAKYLSENLQMPVFSKDNIKEFLFDEVGFCSRQEKNKLGRASMKIMYHAAEQMMQVGAAFILENNFEQASREELLQILEQYHYVGITVRLIGETEVIYNRFAERDKSLERHRGHVVNDCYPEPEGSCQENPTMLTYEKFLSGMERRGYNGFVANGPCIEVDTTDFSKVNREEILMQVKQSILMIT